MPGNNNRSPTFSLEGKVSKGKAKWLTRMTYEVNKFPFSNSRELGLYSFNKDEMEFYYKELRKLVDTVLDIVECPICEDTIKQAVLPGCGCTNPVACCSTCWREAGSTCPNCKRQCTSLPFEPIDDIVRECHLFYKEKGIHKGMKCGIAEMKRVAESYYRFLKQSEMELMCNYCFGHLEDTMTVNCRNEARKPCCNGCHALYMECYSSTEPCPFPTFDRLNKEYADFFLKTLGWCRKHKNPVYSDPLPPVTQPNMLKLAGLRRKNGIKNLFGLRRKMYGVYGLIKKAVVVAACAYLVVYFAK